MEWNCETHVEHNILLDLKRDFIESNDVSCNRCIWKSDFAEIRQITKKKLIKLYRNQHPDICVVSIEDIDWSLDPITQGLFLCEMQQTRSSMAALSPMPGSINLLLCLYGHADVGVWSASNSILPLSFSKHLVMFEDVWWCLLTKIQWRFKRDLNFLWGSLRRLFV